MSRCQVKETVTHARPAGLSPRILQYFQACDIENPYRLGPIGRAQGSLPGNLGLNPDGRRAKVKFSIRGIEMKGLSEPLKIYEVVGYKKE